MKIQKRIGTKFNAELPRVRLESEQLDKMQKCLDDINKQSQVLIEMAAFRRMAYNDFTERVIAEGLELEFSPQLK